MKPPVLVTPPASPIVTQSDMLEHMRITDAGEGPLVTAYTDAATSYLDGWKGVLGRAVMSQTWREEFDGFGYLRLAMPDVVSITVTAKDDLGASVSVSKAVLNQDYIGFYVDTEGGAAATVVVDYVVAMPAQQVAAVQQIVKLLVGNWYENRAATDGTAMIEVPMAAGMLIDSVRWSRM